MLIWEVSWRTLAARAIPRKKSEPGFVMNRAKLQSPAYWKVKLGKTLIICIDRLKTRITHHRNQRKFGSFPYLALQTQPALLHHLFMHMLLLDLSARESESAVVQRRQWSSCSDSVIPTISHLFLQFRNSFLQFVHLVVVKPRSIVSCGSECNLEMTVNWKGKSILIKRMQTNTLRITWWKHVKHIMRSCGEQLWTVPTCIPRAPAPPLSRTPHQDNTRTLKVNGEPREWWDVLRILKWSLNTKCNVLRTS